MARAATPTGAWAVRVPASTSNLGPGFDLLGLALSLFVEVEVETVPGGAEHRFEALEGTARDWPRGPDNLLLQAFDRGRALHGAPPLALRVRARSEVPVGRGLGSSGAAIAAGLLLAAATAGESGEREQALLDAGCDLEGHPDNTTASLLGGCTLALPTADGLRVVRQSIAAGIGWAVAWPAATLSTQRAREALPARVEHGDAVENPRRLAFLLEGLRTGDAELLRLGGEDRLHVAHRLPLVPGGSAALCAAREAGAWLATVSGSGTALVALGPPERVPALAEAMRGELEAASGPAQARVVEPVCEPPEVRRMTPREN